MPYIAPFIREQIEKGWRQAPLSVGELNYVITKAVDGYISDSPLSYAAINAAIGVLECAKLELYRRVAAPYETDKMHENGDVYTNARDL